jgi:hypothetical protein
MLVRSLIQLVHLDTSAQSHGWAGVRRACRAVRSDEVNRLEVVRPDGQRAGTD